MAKSKCPRCFGGIEFPKSGIGHVVECPHCSQKILLRLNPFAPASGPALEANIEIRVSKCEPAPAALLQKKFKKRTIGVSQRRVTGETIRARTMKGDVPAYVARVRAEPATEKQKEKLRYFGYDFDENITKGQASDALDKCARDFPQANQTYYSRPATEEQLVKLQEINTCCKPGELFYDFEEEGLPTYGEAKDSLQDWELYKREQVENSDLMDCMDAYWEKHHWDDDYEESERGRFDNACFEILDGWQFEKFGDLPTRKQVAKIWKLVKSRKSNKAELPTHGELIAALLESRGGIGRPRG